MRSIFVKLAVGIVLLLLATSAWSMTMEEFNKVKSGDILMLKLEYNGKVYVQGECVAAFKYGESAQVASTNPNNAFIGTFHRSYLTPVSSSNSDIDSIRAENTALRAENAGLKGRLTSVMSALMSILSQYNII
jgi:hypothetical protein